jgi:hypothetical protein
LAWRNGLNDFAMPYMINTMKEQFSKVRVDWFEKGNETVYSLLLS